MRAALRSFIFGYLASARRGQARWCLHGKNYYSIEAHRPMIATRRRKKSPLLGGLEIQFF
jgi:hypothetical protein